MDGTDFAGSRDNPHNFLNRAAVDDEYDYNRDSFVDGTDLAIARDNTTNFLTALRLISVPAAHMPEPSTGCLALVGLLALHRRSCKKAQNSG